MFYFVCRRKKVGWSLTLKASSGSENPSPQSAFVQGNLVLNERKVSSFVSTKMFTNCNRILFAVLVSASSWVWYEGSRKVCAL